MWLVWVVDCVIGNSIKSMVPAPRPSPMHDVFRQPSSSFIGLNMHSNQQSLPHPSHIPLCQSTSRTTSRTTKKKEKKKAIHTEKRKPNLLKPLQMDHMNHPTTKPPYHKPRIYPPPLHRRRNHHPDMRPVRETHRPLFHVSPEILHPERFECFHCDH